MGPDSTTSIRPFMDGFRNRFLDDCRVLDVVSQIVCITSAARACLTFVDRLCLAYAMASALRCAVSFLLDLNRDGGGHRFRFLVSNSFFVKMPNILKPKNTDLALIFGQNRLKQNIYVFKSAILN